MATRSDRAFEAMQMGLKVIVPNGFGVVKDHYVPWATSLVYFGVEPRSTNLNGYVSSWFGNYVVTTRISYLVDSISFDPMSDPKYCTK